MNKSKKYLIAIIVISTILAAALTFDLYIICSIIKSVLFLIIGGIAIAIIASIVVVVFLIIDIVLIVKYCQHKKRENNEAK